MTLAERKLIAQINHWARRHGWEPVEGVTYRNAARDVNVNLPLWSSAYQYFIGDALVTVTRGKRAPNGKPGGWTTSNYPARSVTEAVDILVSVGVLPERFHSIYRALIGIFDDHAERAMALTRDRTAMRPVAAVLREAKLYPRRFR